MIETKVLKIEGRDILAKFPNVGQLMDIESTKLALTNNNYITLSASPLRIHSEELDIIDAISYLLIICPEIKEIYDIKNIREISIEVSKKLLNIYHEQFIDWFSEIMKNLTKIEDVKNEPKPKKE